jgi:hypothetical protein
MGISIPGPSAASRRRAYREAHPTLTSDDSVKYHEDRALDALTDWFLNESQESQPARQEMWSLSDYHPPGQFRVMAGWDRYRLGKDRRPILCEMDRLLVGKRNGITRFTFLGRYTGGNDVLIPEVAEGGAYDGVILNQTVDGFRRYGIVLNRTINEGDKFRLRWQFRYDHTKSSGDPLPVMGCVYEIDQSLYKIHVVFDPNAPPACIFSAVAPAGSWPRRGGQPLCIPLDDDCTAHAAWSTVPREYAAGIYWEWSE